MSILSRILTLLHIRAHAALDELEDPVQVMDYSYSKQVEHLQQLRSVLVEVVTNEKRLELQQKQLQEHVSRLHKQAHSALQAQREDLARLALQREEMLVAQLQTYEKQLAQLRSQEERLIDMERRVSATIEAFRTQKESVKVHYNAAQTRIKAQGALAGISEEMGETNLAMQRAQDRILTMQAYADAMDTLLEQGMTGEYSLQEVHDYDGLDSQLQQVSTQQNVETQLQAMKAQLHLDGPSAYQKRIEGPDSE